MSRRATIVMLTAFACFLVVVTTARALLSGLDPHSRGDGHRRVLGHGQIRFDGRGPEAWAWRFHRERRKTRTLRHRMKRTLSAVVPVGPVEAITLVFGPYAGQAISVAQCESHLSPDATNGQYVGLFQMGAGERSRYGDGRTPLEQARAAYVYFVLSGRDWSPWTCRPN